ncbi:MAG: hypothetical protein WC499_03000 [Patescibacteria group bacterium]
MKKFIKEQLLFMLIMVVSFLIAAWLGKKTSSVGSIKGYFVATLCTLAIVIAFICNVVSPFTIERSQITSNGIRLNLISIIIVLLIRVGLTIGGFILALAIVFNKNI